MGERRRIVRAATWYQSMRMTKPVLTFRDLLDILATRNCLRRVARAVDPRHQLVAILRKVQKGLNQPLLFENVSGSPAPIATNVLCRRSILAAALGIEEQALLATLVARERAMQPLQTVAEAPVHELCRIGDIDIARDLPQVIHCTEDAGPYITAGVCISHHPETGVHNASWNRIQIVAGDHARIRMMAPQHLGQYQAIAERLNKPLPIAVVIGAPPALMLSAASKIPFDADELATAGGWQGAPLRVTTAKTVPLTVPADAEFVIEGEVLPNLREEEGPFGEFTDGYVAAAPNHVLRVTAITRRRDAIYHVILAGGTEDLTLLGVPLQTLVYKQVSAFATVRDVGTPGQILGCVISVDKASDDQVRAVMLAALAAHPWMKVVIVVDGDVDPHDANEVLWAVHTRHTPETGILAIPRLASFQRDDVRAVHRGKIAIDATVPMNMRAVFRRRRFAGQDDIRLEDFLDGFPAGASKEGRI